jgi:FecR protein
MPLFMKTRFLKTLALVGLAIPLPLHAVPLTESTFTEVIKDVNVVAQQTQSTTPAQVSELFKAPDLVRTGPDSRAELTAPDQTVTRVGANTVFSFDPVGRNLRLEQGSVLFHPPAGVGGGTIKSGGSSAAVLGTTLIVSATANGGFKVILLEGKGQVTLPNGKTVMLTAGQMVFVLPGGTSFSPVLTINLAKLVGGSLLINGFPDELSSMSLINAAIHKQNLEFASGQATDTGLSANYFANPQPPGNGFDTINTDTYQVAVPQPLSDGQFQTFLGSGPGNGGPGGRGIITFNTPQG